MTDPVVRPAPAGAASIFDRAVLLKIEFGSLGLRRKVPSTEVEVNADRKMLSVSKKLLESDAITSLRKLDSRVRAYVMARAVPSNFRSGVHLFPITMIVEANHFLETCSEARDALVEEFLSDYERAKEEARTRLGDLFNELDYPAEQRVRAAFHFGWTWIEAGPANSLRSLSASMFEAERDKFESEMRDAMDDARALLREGFANLVEHMSERLAPGANGRPKVFKASTVENLREFMEVFDARNLADDAALKALVDRARDLLGGASPDDIRGDEGLRERIRAGMSQVQGDLAELVQDRPARRLRLEDPSEGQQTSEAPNVDETAAQAATAPADDMEDLL